MSDVMSRPAARTLLLNPQDNVAVALGNLDVGTDTAEGVRTTKRVPKGHKFAVRTIGAGETIVKFGQIIGRAKVDIPAGEWVHEHNAGIGEDHISKTMKAHFKGDTSDIKKAAKGELSKDEVAKLVTAVKALSAEKPPEGDAADYKKKNDALVVALEKLARGAEGAGAAVKEAANCKACHDAHKPK